MMEYYSIGDSHKLNGGGEGRGVSNSKCDVLKEAITDKFKDGTCYLFEIL